MPHVSVNNDPLLDRLIFGYDGTNYRVVKVDTDGNIVVAQKASANYTAQTHGYISGAWQKQPLQFGFSDTVSQTVTNSSLSAGTNNIDSSTVPSGEVWVITNISYRYVGTPPTKMRILISVDNNNVYVDDNSTITSGDFYPIICNAILGSGDFVRLNIAGATGGDSADLRYAGYKFDIDL